MDSRQNERALFLSAAGLGADALVPLAGDASARTYFRMELGPGRSLILMDAAHQPEMLDRFIEIGGFLSNIGLSAPHIIAADSSSGFLLLEDFGDDLFVRIANQGGKIEARCYDAAIEAIVAMISATAPATLPKWGVRNLARLTMPAFEWYASVDWGSVSDVVAELETVFAPLTTGGQCFSHRDYHAENLIWLPDRAGLLRVGMLDFQDAVITHFSYDFVSLTRDARRDLGDGLALDLTRRFAALSGISIDELQQSAALMSVQRNLRILGILSRLSVRDGKPEYVDLIPRVWNHLSDDLGKLGNKELSRLVSDLLPQANATHLSKLKGGCV